MQNFSIRMYLPDDKVRVITLWQECGLIVPWNNPETDVERKHSDSPELFFVGEMNGELIASCMGGYDGHRGWIYFLAVKQSHRNRGVASKMVEHVESALVDMGCPKVELMVRNSNEGVIAFYNKNNYKSEAVVVLSKRLIDDDPHPY